MLEPCEKTLRVTYSKSQVIWCVRERRRKGENWTGYQCEFCKLWHLLRLKGKPPKTPHASE